MTPLGAQASAWLLRLADPQRLVPAPPGAPPWEEAGALLEAASAHGVLPAVLRGLGQASRTAGGAGGVALATWRQSWRRRRASGCCCRTMPRASCRRWPRRASARRS